MKSFRKSLAIVLSIAILSMSFSSLHAAWVNNEQIIGHTQQVTAKAQLIDTINRAEVQQQLITLGVEPEYVTNRINQMTAEEIAQLNQQIESLPAGGDLIGVLLIIFIVFVITDVIGATDIFPFIKSVN